MSVQTLYTAATGMESLQTKLDVIANNLANVNTTAFKRGRANFEDLFYRHEVLPGTDDGAGNLTPTGTSIGLGSRVQSIQTDFRQGAFEPTNNPLDVTIRGNGFFEVQQPGGDLVYTRAGNFSINANGTLVISSAGIGRVVQPEITFPVGTAARDISISANGAIFRRDPATGQPVSAGILNLAQFINPEGLLHLGENLYAATLSSGAVQTGVPGAQGFGDLQSNSLEASNVEPVTELIDLIKTQRAFELNSQTVQAGDQILQLIANLRR